MFVRCQLDLLLIESKWMDHDISLIQKGLKQGKDSEDKLYLIREETKPWNWEVMKSQAWLLSGVVL